MTRLFLASLLPLAFGLGCGPSSDCIGDECVGVNTDCIGECSNTDTDPGTNDFAATLRSVAPYGWVGDHFIEPVDEDWGIACSGVNECDKPVDQYGNYYVSLQGETWMCTNQVQLVEDRDANSVVDLEADLTGDGICGLTPEGEYSGLDVRTDVGDQIWIHIESWMAIVTGDTFFYGDDEYLLEGDIAEDLSSITYFLEVGASTDGGTITLED